MSARKVRFMVRQVEGVLDNDRDGSILKTVSSTEGIYREYHTLEEARAVKRQNPTKLEIVRITTTTVS